MIDFIDVIQQLNMDIKCIGFFLVMFKKKIILVLVSFIKINSVKFLYILLFKELIFVVNLQYIKDIINLLKVYIVSVLNDVLILFE